MKEKSADVQTQADSKLQKEYPKKQLAIKLNKKTVEVWILLILMIFAGSVYKTYRNGFGMIVQSTETYQYSPQAVTAPVNFQVSLEDLKSNEGMAVYNDGTCKIQLVSVKKVENGYTLSFEAKPSYDFFQSHAVLISAAKEEYFMTGAGMAHSAVLTAKLSDLSENGKAEITQGEVNDIGTRFSYSILTEKRDTTLSLQFTGLQKQNWDIE